MSGFSVALKLHKGVISTQYLGPLKAARSRKLPGYLVPGGDGYPHSCTESYAAPAPTVFAAPGLVVEHTSPDPAVHAAPAPVVQYVAPAPVASYAVPAPAVFAAPAPVM